MLSIILIYMIVRGERKSLGYWNFECNRESATMDKMTVYDKAYNKAKLALKLQIEIILESYKKDLANVIDDDELCLIIQAKMMALSQVLNEINDM